MRKVCAARRDGSSIPPPIQPCFQRNLGKMTQKVYAVRMPKPDTATRIRNAARSLFEREGADAVSMRKVAAAVGLSPMALYRHFESREALLREISDDSFREIAKHWAALRQGTDPIARLLATQRIYLDYALTYPHLFDHAFSTRRTNARRYPDDFRARRSPTANVMHEAVEDAQQKGLLREGDSWDVTMTLWAHAHGLIALYRADRFSYDEAQFRTFFDRSMQSLLHGLCR